MSSFKSKLLNGFAWRLCFYISSFILNILIANKFGPAGAGIFYLLLNNIAFVVLLLNFGLDASVAYFTSRKEINTSQLLSLSIQWSVFVTGGLFFFYFAGIQFNFLSPYTLAPYLIINIGGSLLANCESCILFSSEDNKTPNLTFTLMNIMLILLLPGILLLKNSVYNIDYTKLYLLVTAAPSLVFLACLFFRKIQFCFAGPNKFWIHKIISFSLQSFIYGLLYALLLRCDYWMVNYFCTTNEMGNYLQANKLTQIILLVPTLASFSLFPLLVSNIKQGKNVHAKLLKLISIYFYIGLLLCIGVISVGYWVFPLLYGEGFSKMYPVFVLLSPGILMLGAAYPLSTFYSGKNLIRLTISALILSIIILLFLDILLIPALHIYGAAISSTLAYGFYFFYLLFRFKKDNGFNLLNLLNIGAIIEESFPAIFIKRTNHEN